MNPEAVARSADALGWRAKIAVVAPSTNTVVQPDFDDMRPRGVANHFGRIMVANMPIRNDDDFKALMDTIGRELLGAVDRCLTCAPDYLMMGMSSHMFWGGLDASAKRRQELADHAGVPVTAGSFAAAAALRLYGATRIAVISPYQPIADAQVTRFFSDCGFNVVRLIGLRCPSPVAIAEVSEDDLRETMRNIDSDDVDALVQVGTNLSAMRLAAEAEKWLAKPVIAINAATYWHRLRELGIADKIVGFGSLLEDH